MHTPSEEELTVDILGYMLEHPNAMDGVEGIVAWWFSQERLRVGLTTVQQILERLAAQELIVAHHIPGGRVLYSLNKQRKDDVARFIGKVQE
jgi:Fe2+ or Zn2+ uptake regulation protein